jgi:8-oxo-dGTP diphosphatase
LVAPASDAPRIRVAALILIDGAVVLVRHRKAEATYHLLPGGGVERGETLRSALEREVAEETGLSVRIGRPLVVNDTIDPAGTRHLVNITFAATVLAGRISDTRQDERVEGVELLPPERLRELDFRPPITEALIRAIDEQESFHATYLDDVFTVE